MLFRAGIPFDPSSCAYADGPSPLLRTARRLVPVLALATTASNVFAQSAPDVRPSDLGQLTVTGERDSLPHVVPNASTGTKTNTPLMETPVSVQVVPQQVLLDQGTFSLQRAATNVSGVFSGAGEPGQETLFIRGFQTTQTLWNGFRIDEYSTVGGGTVGSVSMDNAERTEILKGPAGILYGRIEPGGTVNVITRQPQTRFQGAALLSYGSWADVHAALDLTGPINADKTLLYRLNAGTESSNSWVWGATLRSESLAPVIEWRLSPATTLSLEGLVRREVSSGGNTVALVDPTTNQLVPTPRQYTPLASGSEADVTRAYMHLSHRFDEDWSLSWKLLHTMTIERPELLSYISTAYLPPVAPGNITIDRYLTSMGSHNETDATILDVNGHFSLLGVQNSLLLGADFYHTPISFPNLLGSCCYPTNFFAPGPLPPGALVTPNGPNGYSFGNDSRQLSNDFGIYAQDQLTLPHDLHLLLGARFQHYVETNSANGAPGTPLLYGQTLVDHAVTPRAGLLWRALPWLSPYYSYTENFGNNTGFEFPDTPLPPESARQHETGVKMEGLDGRLQSSLVYYHIEKFHLASGDPQHSGFNIVVGAVLSRGLEFDLQGALTPDWDVIANGSWNDTYVLAGAEGCSGSICNSYVTGQHMPGVPTRMFNLWSTHRLTPWGLSDWKIGAGADFASATYYPGTGRFTAPYWTEAVMASWEHQFPGLKAQAQLNLDNLFNRQYYTNLYPAGSYTFLNWGNPRQARLTLRADF